MRGTFGSTSRVIASVTRQSGKKLKDSKWGQQLKAPRQPYVFGCLCGKVLDTKRWVLKTINSSIGLHVNKTSASAFLPSYPS